MNLLFKALAAVSADIIAIIHEFLFYYSRVTETPPCVLWGWDSTEKLYLKSQPSVGL